MKKNTPNLKTALPHIIAVLTFIIICAAYFSPQLKGYKIFQMDHMQFIGMSKEIRDFREIYDSEPLWTNSTFSGMPAYQIDVRNPNIINKVKNYILKIIPSPIGYFFFLMAGFYIMLILLDVKPWIAVIGSIAYGLASFNILYMVAGHNAKILAISFIPPIIGSIVHSYRKNVYTGSAVLAVFLCLHLSANHLQMTYYLLFLIVGVVLAEFYNFIKNGEYIKFLRISGFLLVAGIMGLLPTMTNLSSTGEYSKYTTRGKSELTIKPVQTNRQPEKENNDALNRDYIKVYNLGNGELWSLVIPNVKGGANGKIGQYPKALNKVNPTYRAAVAENSSYWGEQAGSGGAFYYGASIFLLFVLGAFFVKDKIKWALIAVSALALILSLKYSGIVDYFIDHFPLYNKFRDTKMMLILVQLAFPLLAMLFLKRLIDKNDIDVKMFLYVTLGVSGLFLLFYIVPKVWFRFLSKEEIEQISDQLKQYQLSPDRMAQFKEWRNELIEARIAIFRKDCFRSLFFILATGTLVYLYLKKKLREQPFLILLGLVVLIDLWAIDRRYLSNDDPGSQQSRWIEPAQYDYPYLPTPVDTAILNSEIRFSPQLEQLISSGLSSVMPGNLDQYEQQAEIGKAMFRELNFATNYRVFYLQNPFNETRTSFFHKSLGGYHGAKLKKYQELIDFHITPEHEKLIDILNSRPSVDSFTLFLENEIPVLNMLNTKYIIHNLGTSPITNFYSYGNAWFVKKINYVKNADEEILALNKLNKDIAIVRDDDKDKVLLPDNPDSTGNIWMKSYKPNYLVYASSSKSDQFAVFSEIYFDAGWNAYVDGKKAEYIKVNYLLRGMNIPAGEHNIEFKFEPESYTKGRKLSAIGSILVIIFVFGLLYYDSRRRKKALIGEE